MILPPSDCTVATTEPARFAAASGQRLSDAIDALARDDPRFRSAFVKRAPAAQLDAEAASLALLRAAVEACGAELVLPRPLLRVSADDGEALVLERLDLRPHTADSLRRFGRELARLHAHPAPCFGGGVDNFIGATPQRNPKHHDWPTFFAEYRLRALADRLAPTGRLDRDTRAGIDRLCAALENTPHAWFNDRSVTPAWVHGDLWSGNHAALPDGRPVIFDPATHTADPEVDLAMLELFGAPGDAFFEGYTAVRPVDPGYTRRRPLYNLYHVLNHCLLFGGGYCADASATVRTLVRSLDTR